MTTARFRHTATLLPSGQVLVVAGGHAIAPDGVVAVLASAEIYDPASGNWIETDSLDAARYRHAATLLPSGKVLISGGEDGAIPNSGVPIGGSELYDPTIGAWTSAGELVTPRYRHTSTLLPSGQVLTVGGRDATISALPDAEIFDLALGSWTMTGQPVLLRYRHSATALPGGKVLIAGGINTNDSHDFLKSAEVYDASSGIWQLTGSLTLGRREHTATLLISGKVLVVGGLIDDNSTTGTAELYDPDNGTWESASSLSIARFRHTATRLPSGKVLVVGGRSQIDSSTPTAELFDPDLNLWRTVSSLENERYWHTATLLATGEVLIAGGMESGSALSSSEIFDPATETFRDTEPLRTPRHSHTATLLPSGQVVVAGGMHGYELSNSELFDPVTETWQATGSLSEPRESHLATLLPSGKVLSLGESTVRTISLQRSFTIRRSGNGRTTASMSQVQELPD